jgi:glutamine amidotransferase
MTIKKGEVAIVNYGMGNLRSVENAVKKLNYNPIIVTTPEELDNYNKIILPGVGSFKKATELLKAKNWVNIIRSNVLEKKKDIFGICLGMQLFATQSEEHGISKGLDLIKGNIKYLGNIGCKNKIPQIGWNSVLIKKKHKYLKNISDNMDFYFVNSYVFVPNDLSNEIGSTNYQIDFSSIISKENIFGTQFHPEKSSKVGLQLLKNFLDA